MKETKMKNITSGSMRAPRERQRSIHRYGGGRSKQIYHTGKLQAKKNHTGSRTRSNVSQKPVPWKFLYGISGYVTKGTNVRWNPL